jgi:hypothetical protein
MADVFELRWLLAVNLCRSLRDFVADQTHTGAKERV